MNDHNSSILSKLIGNSYEAEVQYICKKMRDGGCVIRTYCMLTFNMEAVEVLHYTKVVCTPKEREEHYKDMEDERTTHAWIEENGVIMIQAFEKYGAFEMEGDALIASKKTEGEHEPLIFSKVK